MNDLPQSLMPSRDGTVGALPAERKLTAFLEEQSAESALTHYMQMLLRRRFVVLVAVLIGLGAAVVVTMSTTRLYRATAQLEIDRQAAKVVSNGNDVDPPAQAQNLEFYQTQYGLLKSRQLADMVVRELSLDDNPMLLSGYRNSPLGLKRKLPALTGTRPQRALRAAGIVMAHLSVSPVRQSSLVNISFDSPDPSLSARVVNALADAYIASNLQRRYDSSAYARKFLETRLAQLRQKLEESERSLVDYAGREQIINLDAPSSAGGADAARTTPGQSIVASDLAATNSALAQARNDRIAAEARYNRARTSGGVDTAEGATDPTITSLRSARAQLQAEYQKLLPQYKPDYPSMVALHQQIAEIDKQLSRESAAVVDRLRNEYAIAFGRERELASKLGGLKGDVLDLRRRSIQYNIFQRDVDTNRTLYDGLLQRYKEIGVAGGVGTNNASIVDRALVPSGPFTPKTMSNLLLGLLFGLLVGGGLAFLLEQLDESIIAPHDLEAKLGVPLLGSVPFSADGIPVLAALQDRKSDVAEAYLSIQTALRFSTPEGAPRALLVTSARAAEGKSTTALAIASNFASLGRRTLLIDADMRRPSQHKNFETSNVQGLSNALAGDNNLDRLIQSTDRANLSLMTAGPLPPNPSELLATPRLLELIAELLQRFDNVVIDSPPVMGLADAPLISSYVRSTVFVIVAKGTRAKAARIALKRLSDVQAHILGAVLTKFDARRVGYDYGYNYYGYGQQEKTLIDQVKRLFKPS